MTSRKFYLIFLTACIAGYSWLGMNMTSRASGDEDSPGVCLMKSVTGIPCPSCGSTRSIMAMLNGDFYAGFLSNPMGIIILFILILGPLWTAYDLLFNQKSLWAFYNQMEKIIRKKSVAIPLILLVSANWAWNIIKGL